MSVSSSDRGVYSLILAGSRQICAMPLKPVSPLRCAQFTGRAFSKLSTSRRHPDRKTRDLNGDRPAGSNKSPAWALIISGPSVLKTRSFLGPFNKHNKQ
jgi:hypothetical protein